MPDNLYASLEQFQLRIATDGYSPTADDDAQQLQHLEAASRWIDGHTGRRFYAAVETRYFTAEWYDLLLIEDLISVTTLKTDEDEDRTYETTWAATDYDLEPYNAPLGIPPGPYVMIRVTPNGDYSFPIRARRAVEIAGVWGWPQTSTTSSATLAEDLDASETDVDVSSGSVLETGTVIQIDSEKMIVDAIVTNTLTVRRGYQGTTAATHTSGAAITVITPPRDINEACLLYAARLFKRKDAVLGVAGSTQLGTITTRVPEDMDVQRLLRPFVRAVP